MGVCVCVRYGCRWGRWVVHSTTSSKRAALQNVGVGSCYDAGEWQLSRGETTQALTPECHSLLNDMPNSWLHSYTGSQVQLSIVTGHLMRDFTPVIEIGRIEWHPALSLATVTNSP